MLEKVIVKLRNGIIVFFFVFVSVIVGLLMIYLKFDMKFVDFKFLSELFVFVIVFVIFLIIVVGLWLFLVFFFCIMCFILVELFDDLSKWMK